MSDTDTTTVESTVPATAPKRARSTSRFPVLKDANGKPIALKAGNYVRGIAESNDQRRRYILNSDGTGTEVWYSADKHAAVFGQAVKLRAIVALLAEKGPREGEKDPSHRGAMRKAKPGAKK